LVGQTARAEDDDAQILGKRQDRPSERLAELEQTPRRGDRMLDHVNRERDDRDFPVGIGQHRQKRQHAMIERHFLADRRIELIVNQRPGQMPAKFRVARQIGQRPFAPSFICLRMHRANAQRESRISVEEEPVGWSL
jgi:hypothetical protein